jgi:hypothetical protein
MSTPSTSVPRPLRATGLPCPNSERTEELRRALQAGLRHGAQGEIARATGKRKRRLHDELEGATVLSADTLIHGLERLEDPAPVRAALRKANLFHSPALAAGRLLPSIVPAAAALFPKLGRVAEDAALAERDGEITPEEASAIAAGCGEARALLDSIETTANVAAGRGLA